MVEKSEEDVRSDLNNVSKQAFQNKENFDETISKYVNQLQQAQVQISYAQ